MIMNRIPLSLCNTFDAVYVDGDQVIRMVAPDHVAALEQLFASGLPEQLAQAGLMPDTHLERQADGGLLIRQQRLGPLSYPYEWTFRMLAAAGRVVLHVNEIAMGCGYQTSDCHPYNLVFAGSRPLFVDIGSFVPATTDRWPAEPEFRAAYLATLRLMSAGLDTVARSTLASYRNIPEHEWRWLLQPWLRCLGTMTIRTLNTYRHGWQRLPELRARNFESVRSPLLRTAVRWAARWPIPAYRTRFDRLRAALERIALPRLSSAWGDYHDDYRNYDTPTPRFRRIAEQLRTLGVHTVTELAGNQGYFSLYLLQHRFVEHVVCSDADPNAVDAMFQRMLDTQLPLTPAVLDFMVPYAPGLSIPASERFRSEAVLALAVTHHLLLSARYSLPRVFENIRSYTNRYVLIEFMPLGLFDGLSAPPLPPWYTREWFRNGFARHFIVLDEIELEANRILFVGELR